MIGSSEVIDLDALTLDDVYSADYTAHIEAIRHEAALVLSRIAMTHIFANGPATHDPNTAPPRPVSERQPFFFRKRLIEYLDDRGDLICDHLSYSPTPELVKRSQLSDDDYFGGPRDSSTFEAMKCIEAIADGVLQGRDGLVLLEERFGADATWRIWQYLMVDAPPKLACNSLVARALDLRIRSGTPTVVFEGGAGVGATLRQALQIEGFRERIDAINLYGFTDISRPLMRRARDMIDDAVPEMTSHMRFDRVDLDVLDDYDDLPYLQDAATDIIIFESVLHDVENLHRVLTSCRRILKPDGWLAFTIGSRHRPALFFPCELLQSTLHSYYRAQIDPPRRINVGYLSIDEWKASLVDAGFREFRIYPDVADHEKWPYGGIVARR
jgi:SAM-dependent methyltransferase